MYELKELFGGTCFKRKNPIKNFDVSLNKMMCEKVSLTKNAKKKEEISDFMKDLENNDRYTNKEMVEGLQLYVNIIDKLRQQNIDTIKEEVQALISVLSTKKKTKEDEEITTEDLRVEYDNVLNILQENITNVYNILITNENRTAAPPIDSDRRKQYDILLKGYRLIGEVITKKDLNVTELIGNLVLVSDLNNYCAEAWKDTLEELMITYREDIYKILKQDVAITEEKDKIKRRLDKIFFEARDKVFKDLSYGCIAENMIPTEYRPHCLDINKKYLNDVYGFNLGETNLKDAFMHDELYYKLIGMFKRYIENVNIDELVINQAILKYNDVLNGDNAQKAQNEVVDWSYTYMLNNNLDKVMSRNDFLAQYVYDDMLTGIRKVAIEEILKDKGYINKKTERNSHKDLLNKVKKALNYSEKDDELDKVKQEISKKIDKESVDYYIYSICMGIIESDRYNECEELLGKCMKELTEYTSLMLKKVLKRNNLELLKIMEKNGLDIYAKSKLEKTALHHACEYSSVNVVEYLLDKGIEINGQTRHDERYTALMIACNMGKKEIVDCLIKRGANINIQEGDGETALIYASRGGYLDIVKMLIENGANIEQTGSFTHNTPLLMAVKMGHIDIVKYLLKNKANINNIDRYGMTPLMCACVKGNAEMVEYLMLNGADFEIKNRNWDTALTIACEYGNIYVVHALIENGVPLEKGVLSIAVRNNHLKVAEYLINKGAYINKTNEDGLTPLMVAIKNKNIQMAKLLLKNGATIKLNDTEGIKYLIKEGAGLNLIISAINDNDDRLVKYLIQQGVKIDEKDENKTTPLAYACANGDLKIVKYLLKNGATVNFEGDVEFLPIATACEHGRLEVVRYLVENGVNINKTNTDGETALIYASEKGHIDIVKYLVQHGAKVNEKDIRGMTALMNACYSGHPKVIDYLVQHGANVNEQNIKHETALMYAISRGEYSMVRYLIQKGASIDVQNENGETALMLACINQNEDIVEYLIEKGANLDITNNNGQTVLDIVRLTNNTQIIDLFEQKSKKDIYLQEVISDGNLEVVDKLVKDGLKLSSVQRIYKNLGKVYTSDCIVNMYKENNDLAKSIKDVEVLTRVLEATDIDKLSDLIKDNSKSEGYNKMALLWLGIISEEELPIGVLKTKRALMGSIVENLKSINCEGLKYWAIGSNSLSIVKTIIKSGVISNLDLEDDRFSRLINMVRSRDILDELEKYRAFVKTMNKGTIKNDIEIKK